MRTIKFRGKSIMPIDEMNRFGIPHENGWVTGNLVKNGERPMIVDDILEEIEESIYPTWWVVVDSDSVGQYTGLLDKNSREIYEGYIGWDEHYECYGIATFVEGKFMYVWDSICEDLVEVHDSIEIIGNIYDDKHLLER